MRRSEAEQTPGYLKNLSHIGVGILFGLIVCVLLLLLASFGVSRGFIPESAVKTATLACCFIGAFISALISTRRIRERFLLTGLSSGLLFFVALYLLGAMLFARAVPANGAAGILLSSVIGGVVGAVAGANIKKRRK